MIAIAATTQDTYPPRVQIAITGLSPGDGAEIYRAVAGQFTLVRGGAQYDLSDPSLVVVDAELPFGVPVTYVAYVNAVEYATSATTYDLPGGKAALSDAISGASAEVVISAVGEKTYSRDSTRFRVGGRNIVVSGPQAQAQGSYELFTETTSSRDNLMALLAGATEGIVQIRQPGVSTVTGDRYDGIDAYLAVDQVTERRKSDDGSDPRRLITIEFAETDGWAAALQARGYTYGDVEAYYSGQSYADAALDYPTYLDAIQGDYT